MSNHKANIVVKTGTLNLKKHGNPSGSNNVIVFTRATHSFETKNNDLKEYVSHMNVQEIANAKELYLKGKSLSYIGRELKHNPSTIKRALIKENIKIRSRSEQNIITNMEKRKFVNDNYFDTIGVNQAWLMGFIAADGTIRKERNSIKIGLSYVDREILEKIKKELSIEKNILDYTTSNGFKISELEWTSKKHKDFLSQYGIINNKTYLPMYVPNFKSKDLILAFILGYFDGDGSISISKEKYLRFRICAHRDEILKDIALKLNNLYDIDFTLSLDRRGLYELSINTYYSNQIFQDMYNLNSLHLDRKYQKFLEYINHETTTSKKEG